MSKFKYVFVLFTLFTSVINASIPANNLDRFEKLSSAKPKKIEKKEVKTIKVFLQIANLLNKDNQG